GGGIGTGLAGGLREVQGGGAAPRSERRESGLRIPLARGTPRRGGPRVDKRGGVLSSPSARLPGVVPSGSEGVEKASKRNPSWLVARLGVTRATVAARSRA